MYFQTNVWQSLVQCMPRPTLVELPLPDPSSAEEGPLLQLIPGKFDISPLVQSASKVSNHK